MDSLEMRATGRITTSGRPRGYSVWHPWHLPRLGKSLRGWCVAVSLLDLHVSVGCSCCARHSGEIQSEDVAMLAAWGACTITRDSSRRGFQKYGRALLTSQMLEEIGPSYVSFVGGK